MNEYIYKASTVLCFEKGIFVYKNHKMVFYYLIGYVVNECNE